MILKYIISFILFIFIVSNYLFLNKYFIIHQLIYNFIHKLFLLFSTILHLFQNVNTYQNSNQYLNMDFLTFFNINYAIYLFIVIHFFYHHLSIIFFL